MELTYSDPNGLVCCGDTKTWPGSMWKLQSFQQNHCTKSNVRSKCSKSLEGNDIQVRKFQHLNTAVKGVGAWDSIDGQYVPTSGAANDHLISGSPYTFDNTLLCLSKCDEDVVGCKAWEYEVETKLCKLFSLEGKNDAPANEAFQAGINRALPLGSPFTAGLTGTRATAYGTSSLV